LLIDKSFKEAIASVFYDKEVTLYEVEVVQDDDGSTRREVSETEDTFYANVRFNDLARVQEQYGILEAIDVAITTQETVENGVVLGYGGRLFEIIKVIPFDSHNLIIGKQCKSEFSTQTGQLSA
jgi:hypothetical protein